MLVSGIFDTKLLYIPERPFQDILIIIPWHLLFFF